MLAGTWTFEGTEGDEGPEEPQWRDRSAGIALAGGNPVGQSRDGRWVVALDGAVYNHADLRGRLDMEPLGDHAHTMAEAVARWGVDRALLAMDGKAALALWDRQDRVLHLARDRLGETALYWAMIGGRLVFGSRARELAKHPGMGEIDRSALSTVLRHQFAPAPHALFMHMRKLPPGSVLRVKGGETSLHSYWVAADRAGAVAGTFGGGLTAAAERLNLLLRASVALRLEAGHGPDRIPRVPAILLDGGMASALVAAMAHDLASEELTEIRWADHFDPTPLPHLVTQCDFPMPDPQAVKPLLLAEGARKAGASVVLSADGASSLLGAGSAHGAQARRWAALSQVPHWRRTLSGLLPGLFPHDPASAAKSPAEMVGLSRALWRDLPDPVPRASAPVPWADTAASGYPVLDLMLADLAACLPEAECRWSECAGRVAGVDVRRPLVGSSVAEFVWSLPQAFLEDGGAMLEILAVRYLPPGQRVAVTPPVPVATWLAGPMAEWAGDLLSEARLKRCGLVSPAAIAAARRKERWREVWAALMVEAWAASL